MGLCFSALAFLATTSWEGLGEPTRSRAISRTVVAAEKVFFLRFFGIFRFLVGPLSSKTGRGASLLCFGADTRSALLLRIFALKLAKVQ